MLKASGLEPAGDDGTFLQKVAFERRRSTAAPELVVTPKQGAPRKAEYGAEFDFPLGVDLTTATLPVVVVREVTQMPPAPNAEAALFVDGNATERRGILTKKADPGATGWGLRVAQGKAKNGTPRAPVDPNGGWSPAQPPRPTGDVWLSLNGDLLEEMRSGRIASLQLTTHVEREEVPAFNVVGLLRGAGEGALAEETVVLSAHYDHLGADEHADPVDPAEPPRDTVFNGADDDASGCAAVLELAGQYATGPRPARTLVFLLATGEEIGLVGTWYYLDHPVRPLTSTVANLNFEMIGRPDELAGGAGKLWLTGYELSNLGAAFAEAKLPIAVDPRPGEHFFVRSDNIAFVRRGVVGQTFSTYNLHKDYHRASDEAATLDYAHMEQCVRTAADAVGLVASGKVKPAWLEGKDPNAQAPGGRRGSKPEPAPK
ncbi:MAG: M28 family peptidase [Planctomycetes bacterium]|nr:M28 family peptidase [Planctomycetota bacterium]